MSKKASRETRALQLLHDIKGALYYGEDLKQKDVRDFYKRIWKYVKSDIDKILKEK